MTRGTSLLTDPGRRAARRRAQRQRRAVAAGVAVAVVGGGAGTAWAMTGSRAHTYRLADVQRADVRQTVDADGTLAAHNRATLAFPTPGTVASVRVSVGDHVRAGEVVARLDPSELDAAVTSAKQALAQAEQRLAADENAQATGTSPAATSSGTSRGTSDAGAARILTAPRTPPAAPKGGGSSGLAAAQQAVVAAQHQVDTAVAAAQRDLRRAQDACGAPTSTATSAQGTVDASGTVSGDAGGAALVVLFDATANSAAWQAPDGNGHFAFTALRSGDGYTLVFVRADTAQCSAAVAAADRDQDAVRTANAKLAAAIDALNRAVQAAANSAEASTPTRAPSRPTTPSSTSGKSAPDTSGTTVTAERLAADAKAVDAAQAALDVARHDVGYATLTSPIAGTVGSVSIAAGDTVATSSTSATIVIVGSGTLSTDVQVGLADIDLVKVGEPAQVTVDGHSAPLAATVTYVGVRNTSSSTGASATYPVTVTLDAADPRLFDGMGASVAIDVGTAHGVLTVPLSAVHTTGRVHTLVKYVGGKARIQPVTVGVVGDDRVEIRSGLSAGDRVVLADVGAGLPSSNTKAGPRSVSRLGGGLGKAGGFGGR